MCALSCGMRMSQRSLHRLHEAQGRILTAHRPCFVCRPLAVHDGELTCVVQVRLRPSPASSCIQWGCDRRVVVRIHVRPLGPRWAKSGAQAYYHTARVQGGSTTCSNPYARWRRYIMLCRSRSNSKPIPSGALCDKLGKQRGCGFSTTWH